MTKYDIEKTYEDDPNRCQGVNIQGQCNNKALNGSKFCPVHGGNIGAAKEEAKSLSTYRLAKYQVRLNEMAQHDKLKNLKDEIGILRILMEEMFSRCDTDITLIQHTPQLADLAMKIGKLVETCTKLDRILSQYISKNDAVQLGMEIVGVIADEISDVDTLDTISQKIVEIIERIAGDE